MVKDKHQEDKYENSLKNIQKRGGIYFFKYAKREAKNEGFSGFL